MEVVDIANTFIISRNSWITIFCTSKKALTAITHTSICQKYQDLVNLIYKQTKQLHRQNGHYIRRIWVPIHFGVLENEKTHRSARKRVEKSWKLNEQWSLLAFIWKNVDDICSNVVFQWYEMEVRTRKTSHHGYYIPWIREGIIVVLEKAPKRYATQFYQLIIRHGAVRDYLARIRVIKTPHCWWSGQVD